MSNQEFDKSIHGTRSLDFGNYADGSIEWLIDVHIVIELDNPQTNNRGSISCTMRTGYPIISVTPDSGAPEGDGFWNVLGMNWYGTLHDDARYDHTMVLPGYGGSDSDSEATALSDVQKFCANADSDSDSHPFAYAALCDKKAGSSYPSVTRTSSNTSWFRSSWGRTLVDADFDTNGNLKPIEIAGVFQRFYAYPPQTDPGQYFARTYATPVKADNSIWLTTKDLAINAKYYPWEVRLEYNGVNQWMSCNRDYDFTPTELQDRSGYLRRMKSNSWNDVLNDYFSPDVEDNESWVKVSSNWRNAYLVGTGKTGHL